MKICQREYGPQYYEIEAPEETFQGQIYQIDFILEALSASYRNQGCGYCSIASGDLACAMEHLERYRDTLISALGVWSRIDGKNSETQGSN